MRHANRLGWGALIVGIALGAGLGLAYAWLVNPTRYESVSPRQLSAVEQDRYILMVGHAYSADLDLERARRRLDALGQPEIAARVSTLADAGYLRGGDPDDIRALTVLAEALGRRPLAAEVFSGTLPPTNAIPVAATPSDGSASPTPSETAPSPSPEALNTPTPTLIVVPENATMKLTVLKPICERSGAAGRLEVYVVDAAGGGIPAVAVKVTWDGGEDTFYTGLFPEISPGYADFQMEKDRSYTVTLPGLSEPVVGINSADCLTDDGQVSMPRYQLVFQPSEP